MRLARKLMLLAAIAIPALALMAPSVLGYNSEGLPHDQAPRLIVQQEVHAATDVACPAVTPSPAPVPSPLVTSGGCRLHLLGQGIDFHAHVTAGVESIISRCDVEADVRIDSTGEGYFTHQELTPTPIGFCSRTACQQATPPTGEGRAWDFYLRETAPQAGRRSEHAVIVFCLETQSTPSTLLHCEYTIDVAEYSTHRPEIAQNDVEGHNSPAVPRCEFNGTLKIEQPLGLTGEDQTEQNIEIRHT